jgi:phosphonate transport system ATP-binding protein
MGHFKALFVPFGAQGAELFKSLGFFVVFIKLSFFFYKLQVIYFWRYLMSAAISIRNLNKTYGKNKRVLQDINIEIKPGEMVALIGASGSGKSTLMRHIAGLVVADSATESHISIHGQSVQTQGKLSQNIRRVRSHIGVIFQQFNLVNRLNVLTNVMVGQLQFINPIRSYLGLFSTTEKIKALKALQRVGILQCHAQRASTLSGGQQQRAAIARALVQDAQLILADEPISSLDPESSRKVMEILSSINKEEKMTVVVTLHQIDIALRHCPRVIALRDGKVVFDGAAQDLTSEKLINLFGMTDLSSFDSHFEPKERKKLLTLQPSTRPELLVA